ncbi:ATP synthase F1 subunit gamma [Rhodohalobacter barkolensis]|uniref:ATP synthase gamma chain n=1 Tax=Rhodohalobacter barkolensis TaxID=2053187 RepID=A0A2N0VM78_9BACT|nr:ATP synthase F1 subunit gamma [Rhodohalobacter barkolensis]PKD45244.1 ATP synthase F1 subunit gamma [Rhodohalobacter barkolensis]
MANLRDIRTRISSIENTQQITKAMKMVAAAKLRKAQQRIIATRPYAQKMRSVVSRLIAGAGSENPILRDPEEVESILMIVVGSDRGLCGGFNNNLFKLAEKDIADNYSEYQKNDRLDLITIGRKADGYFKKRKFKVVDSYIGFFDDLNYETTSSIMSEVTEKFIKGKYDKVLVAFNEFKSVITQNRLVDEILPLKTDQFEEENSSNLNEIDYIYEPDGQAILNQLLPVHLNMQLWRAVLESNASEQGARMTAMDNATENAKELKDELKLKYNQARQSAITTEISEIVSGAAALEDA